MIKLQKKSAQFSNVILSEFKQCNSWRLINMNLAELLLITTNSLALIEKQCSTI